MFVVGDVGDQCMDFTIGKFLDELIAGAIERGLGDLELLGDLGMHAMDLAVLLDDVELYPDEMLSDIARRLGFGPLFDEAVGLASA